MCVDREPIWDYAWLGMEICFCCGAWGPHLHPSDPPRSNTDKTAFMWELGFRLQLTTLWMLECLTCPKIYEYTVHNMSLWHNYGKNYKLWNHWGESTIPTQSQQKYYFLSTAGIFSSLLAQIYLSILFNNTRVNTQHNHKVNTNFRKFHILLRILIYKKSTFLHFTFNR